MDKAVSVFFTAPELIACGAFAAGLIWLVVDITIKDVRLLRAILPDHNPPQTGVEALPAGNLGKPLPVFAAAQRMLLEVNAEPRTGD